jgi:hypothetical protein
MVDKTFFVSSAPEPSSFVSFPAHTPCLMRVNKKEKRVKNRRTHTHTHTKHEWNSYGEMLCRASSFIHNRISFSSAAWNAYCRVNRWDDRKRDGGGGGWRNGQEETIMISSSFLWSLSSPFQHKQTSFSSDARINHEAYPPPPPPPLLHLMCNPNHNPNPQPQPPHPHPHPNPKPYIFNPNPNPNLLGESIILCFHKVRFQFSSAMSNSTK